jgi:hypothetical protein
MPTASLRLRGHGGGQLLGSAIGWLLTKKLNPATLQQLGPQCDPRKLPVRALRPFRRGADWRRENEGRGGDSGGCEITLEIGAKRA